jgi:transcriptional regulator with XRE-family HTH domain
VVGVEQWAEIRRLRFVKRLSQREIRRRTGLHRDTIRKALKSKQPPVYRRAPAGSKLDPFKDEIHRLLGEDPRLPARARLCQAPDDHCARARPRAQGRPAPVRRHAGRDAAACPL